MLMNSEALEVLSYDSNPVIAPIGDQGPRILAKMDTPTSESSINNASKSTSKRKQILLSSSSSRNEEDQRQHLLYASAHSDNMLRLDRFGSSNVVSNYEGHSCEI